jgi:hypothetical protein
VQDWLLHLNRSYSEAESANDLILCDELEIKIQSITVALEKFIGTFELAASTCNWEVRNDMLRMLQFHTALLYHDEVGTRSACRASLPMLKLMYE